MKPQKLDGYNDQNYPIEPIWVLENTLIPLILLPFSIALLIFFIWSEIQAPSGAQTRSDRSFIKGIIAMIFFNLFVPFHFFANVIRRATFHFQFEDRFLNLKQGWINKQNRQLPYGVIQNVLITRSFFDRLFGLATVTIQNATQSSAQDIKSQTLGNAGFFGNTIQIPGLTQENAGVIKNALLEKIKDSPIVELGM